MADHEQVGTDPIADDTAPEEFQEDRTFGTLEEAAGALADDDEGEEIEAQAEDEEGEEEQPEEPEEQPDDEPAEDLVTLSDGTQVSLKELEAGQLRMADYTRKTTEAAKAREAAEALRTEYAERQKSFEKAFQSFQNFAEGLIPPKPSPQLARENPGEYTQQVALREAAIAELSELFAIKDDVENQSQQVNEAEQARYREAEVAALVKAMPALKDPARLAKFDEENTAFAKELGFSEDEVSQTVDHRVRQLVHYARIGKKAEHNRQNAQRRIAETPQKGTERRAAVQPSKSTEAMKRLGRTGSLKDALMIDFD